MSAVWEVPVAILGRDEWMSRRLLRESSALVASPPRDARPSRSRHERLPLALRVRAAGTYVAVERGVQSQLSSE